jgi:hypothetical protein
LLMKGLALPGRLAQFGKYLASELQIR